mmetsp:Transcript_25515/g.43510  ORF Transcript_25515/g.43510 Transcript_25515/m.43510 type:complete len:257 (+) Transcript_25515:2-772(+)
MSSIARVLARIDKDNQGAYRGKSLKSRPGCPFGLVIPNLPTGLVDDESFIRSSSGSGFRVVMQQHRRADEVLSGHLQSEIQSLPAPPGDRIKLLPHRNLSPVSSLHLLSAPFSNMDLHIAPSDSSRYVTAVCRVQASWRGSFARWFQVDIGLMRLAATVIQRRWRTYRYRRHALIDASEGGASGGVVHDAMNRGGLEESASWGLEMDFDSSAPNSIFPLTPRQRPPPGASLDAGAWQSWVDAMSSFPKSPKSLFIV